ncbi:hypothetical protein ADUPG1_009678 [Aduncisulcus paluster]|uniref:Uncharacterized protein n=1 Tax=Aduncisulcus paluster TaxID=2918883 RepID=A0ABQ5KZ78_9EUKA|nr:hypothetical protein ADUPG1_009678 [Aduncisulcus paluster]
MMERLSFLKQENAILKKTSNITPDKLLELVQRLEESCDTQMVQKDEEMKRRDIQKQKIEAQKKKWEEEEKTMFERIKTEEERLKLDQKRFEEGEREQKLADMKEIEMLQAAQRQLVQEEEDIEKRRQENELLLEEEEDELIEEEIDQEISEKSDQMPHTPPNPIVSSGGSYHANFLQSKSIRSNDEFVTGGNRTARWGGPIQTSSPKLERERREKERKEREQQGEREQKLADMKEIEMLQAAQRQLVQEEEDIEKRRQENELLLEEEEDELIEEEIDQEISEKSDQMPHTPPNPIVSSGGSYHANFLQSKSIRSNDEFVTGGNRTARWGGPIQTSSPKLERERREKERKEREQRELERKQKREKAKREREKEKAQKLREEELERERKRKYRLKKDRFNKQLKEKKQHEKQKAEKSKEVKAPYDSTLSPQKLRVLLRNILAGSASTPSPVVRPKKPVHSESARSSKRALHIAASPTQGTEMHQGQARPSPSIHDQAPMQSAEQMYRRALIAKKATSQLGL